MYDARNLQQVVTVVTAGTEQVLQLTTRVAVAASLAVMPAGGLRAIFFEERVASSGSRLDGSAQGTAATRSVTSFSDTAPGALGGPGMYSSASAPGAGAGGNALRGRLLRCGGSAGVCGGPGGVRNEVQDAAAGFGRGRGGGGCAPGADGRLGRYAARRGPAPRLAAVCGDAAPCMGPCSEHRICAFSSPRRPNTPFDGTGTGTSATVGAGQGGGTYPHANNQVLTSPRAARSSAANGSGASLPSSLSVRAVNGGGGGGGGAGSASHDNTSPPNGSNGGLLWQQGLVQVRRGEGGWVWVQTSVVARAARSPG